LFVGLCWWWWHWQWQHSNEVGIACQAVTSNCEIFICSCGIQLKSDNVESEYESSACVLVDWSGWEFDFVEVTDEIFVSNDIPESLEEDNDHEWHSLRST
jgi:hypothetical protein